MNKDAKHIAIVSGVLIFAGIFTLGVVVGVVGTSAGYETNSDKIAFAWWYYVEDGEQRTYDELYLLSSLYVSDFNLPFYNSTELTIYNELTPEERWWNTARVLYEKEKC